MKILKLSLFSLSLISTFNAHAKNNVIATLAPFETDGCTLFLDGPITHPKLWRHCCVEHDLRYWFGGSVKDMDDSDLRLGSCVEKVAGERWGKLVYAGVRAGHSSPIKNKRHWAWAWSVKREKTPLTAEEITYVKAELVKLKLEKIDIEEFIKINFP